MDNTPRPSNILAIGRGVGKQKPPAYNKIPINFFNPLRVACGYDDSKYLKERSKILAIHGFYAGSIPAAGAYALHHKMLEPGFHLSGKGPFFLNSLYFGAIGAASALSYIGGVRLTNKLRDGKDDWINHFIGAFFLMAPVSIYRMSYRVFVVGGVYMGAFLGVMKQLHQEGFSFNTFQANELKTSVTNARYPEFYLRAVLAPNSKEEEMRKAVEYQRKDF